MANEKRLIDANALWDEVDKSKYDNPHTIARVKLNHHREHDHFLNMIFNAPTVDAVEVVRCKDCKHRASNLCPMETVELYPWFGTKNEAFCSYGERRTDDG